jgi:hypothetical protein
LYKAVIKQYFDHLVYLEELALLDDEQIKTDTHEDGQVKSGTP